MAGVLGRVVAAVVYRADGSVFGRVGYAPEARTASGDLAALLAAVRAEAPAGLALELAGPNPVGRGAAVALAYAVPEAGPVRVSVYDVLGREVARLADGVVAAGRHQAALNAGALPSGTYVVRLVAGDEVRVRRVTVAR